LVVGPGDLPQRDLVPVLTGHMGDDQAATGAQGITQPGHAPVRVFLVAHEMKQQRHAQRYRLGEVDDSPQLGVPEDAAGVSQVAGDEDHVGQAVKVGAATRETTGSLST
jgi:hypothetical protein